MDGQLVYPVDDRGNRLPDFSHVGYRNSEQPIPDVPAAITLRPRPGDNTAAIQNAIDRHAIKLNRNSEHTWVRNVAAKYFGWSVVSASGRHATVRDCVSLGHASEISGGRRYPFMINGQRNLVERCIAIEGRHEFVVQARTAGPNVFVDCLGIDSKSSAGPHHRYAVGTLFDNVKSEHYMESRFRGSSGTGHGWAGTQTAFYNCIAPGFKVQAPPGDIAWVLGCDKRYDPQTRLSPASLFYRQLEERVGTQTVQPHEHLGQFKWAEPRLEQVK